MKFLIWISCIVIGSVILTFFAVNNIGGAIPTIAVVGPMTILATTLCKKWDKYHSEKQKIDDSFDVQIITKSEEICFCRKCGEKLIENSDFCSKCGTKVIREINAYTEMLAKWEFCKNCGADISNDQDICHVCKEKIIRKH